ncbi:SdpI family protein [Candidatus Woesearchaeota archaeon]|nr:SdpI family protein [Candidatus Woesearchaeota archaeon]
MKGREWIIIVLIAVTFLLGYLAEPHIVTDDEGRMITHWDASGNPNGYSSKFVGLYLMPVIILGIYLLFLAIPKIAVHKKSFEDFRQWFTLKLIMVFVLACIYAVSLVANMGLDVPVGPLIMILISVLFFYLGHIMKDMKQNYFMGIRTPWTLANETVWKKTHHLGGLLFKAFAIIFLLGALVNKGYVFAIVIAFILLGVVFLVLYSYLEYRKVVKK